MIKRTLGRSSIEVAPFALGGNVFGWTIDETTSFAVLDAFVANGFQLIDTANVYSAWVKGNAGGESEAIIGHWIKARKNRDKVVIATKVGKEMGDGSKGLKKKEILKQVEQSLARLQTDYIDLYQSHDDDSDSALEERFEAYQELIKAGKVKAIGASNYPAAKLEQALKLCQERNLPSYVTLQPHYNLVERAIFEDELQAVCLKYKLGVLPYYSLASGFLSGKYHSKNDLEQSVRGHSAATYLNEKGLKILQTLEQIAQSHQVSVSAISLAWLLTKPCVVAPIASATSVAQLEQNLKATDIKLKEDELKQLDLVSN